MCRDTREPLKAGRPQEAAQGHLGSPMMELGEGQGLKGWEKEEACVEPHHHELWRPTYDRGLQNYEGTRHTLLNVFALKGSGETMKHL